LQGGKPLAKGAAAQFSAIFLANLEGGNRIMKGLLRSVAAFGVIGSLVAIPAQAQTGGNRITAGFGGGVTIPLGSTSDVVKTGWNAGGVVQFKPATGPIGFQVDVMYQQLKASDASKALDPLADKSQIWSGTGNVVFWLPVAAETKIRPYLLGGGGIYNVKAKDTDGTSASVTKFGINAGAGFDFDLQPRVGIFIEGRFHDVFTEGPDVKFIPIAAGVRFHT
jgi:opacity protein-like surface antigen